MRPATPAAGPLKTIRLGEERPRDIRARTRPRRRSLARRVQLTTSAGRKQLSAPAESKDEHRRRASRQSRRRDAVGAARPAWSPRRDPPNLLGWRSPAPDVHRAGAAPADRQTFAVLLHEIEIIHGVVEPARRQPGLRRPAAAGSGRLADRAGRAGLPAGPQRRGQEHAAAADRGPSSSPTRARSSASRACASPGCPRRCPEGRGGTVADEVAEGLADAGHRRRPRRPPGRCGHLPDGPGRRRPVRDRSPRG